MWPPVPEVSATCRAGACPCRMSIGCAVLRTTRNKRGETQFRTEFLCLLSLSKKVSRTGETARPAVGVIEHQNGVW